jgi:GNAT superfamily N-acetyltransferase
VIVDPGTPSGAQASHTTFVLPFCALEIGASHTLAMRNHSSGKAEDLAMDAKIETALEKEHRIVIETWTSEHPRWSELTGLVSQLEQSDWAAFTADWHLSSHWLVALHRDKVAGFLYYVTQAIGVEEDRSAVTLAGTILTEGKVIAFGVAPEQRRRGIGRLLQAQLIQECRAQGCHQIRSHSGDNNIENHQLKLSLGFAVHPLIPESGKDGVYFLLPLRSPRLL